jgi:hypothetical protein
MNRIMPCTAAHPPVGRAVLTEDEVDVGAGHSSFDHTPYMKERMSGQ